MGIAVVAGAALLLAAVLLDRAPGRIERRSRITDAVDVVTPAPLREEETREGGAPFDQERVALEAGAWVQVADDKGKLQQRYRAHRIDPEPDRWVRMERPNAVMFPSDDRVVTMQADHGRARIPKRALQAGRLTGNVEIKTYRGVDGAKVPFKDDQPIGDPSLVIKSDEAQFDEVLGEIRCDDWVDVTADDRKDEGGVKEHRTVSFQGQALSISIDPDAKSVERLTVEKARGPIVITEVKSVSAGARVAPVKVESGPASDDAGTANAGTASAAPAATASAPANAPGNAPAGAPANAPSGAPAAPTVPGPSAVTAADPPSVSDASDTRPYVLTLYDDVVIQRIADGKTSIVRGDRLVAVFSLRGGGLKNAFAKLFPPLPTLDAGTIGSTLAQRGATGAFDDAGWTKLPLPGRITLLTLAAADEERAKEQTITIRYAGRLVMVPAESSAPELLSPDDVWLTIDSDPSGARRRVEIEDLSTKARALCEQLVYHGFDESVDLIGGTRQSLEVESPNLKLEVAPGGTFHFVRPTGFGELAGPGTMKVSDRDRARAALPAEPSPPASSTPPVAGAPGVQGAPASPALPMRDLEITWEKSLQIQLEADGSDGAAASDQEKSRIKSAHFKGDVDVEHVDFALTSNELDVFFSGAAPNANRNAAPKANADADVQATVSRIVALGKAHARRLGDAGSLKSDSLTMDLTTDAAGKAIPVKLTAQGAVEAQDETQTMWSDDLIVDFEPMSPDAIAARARKTKREGFDLAGGGEMGDVEVTRVQAGTLQAGAAVDRGVQLLLKDGARVYARKLDGSARDRTVTLEGPEVMIVQKNVVADRLQHLRIDEAAKTVTAEGPGRFRQFAQPVAGADHAPLVRPDPTGEVSLDAKWDESMKFTEGSEGRGSLDLTGKVRVRASRTPREFSKLDAETVQIDLRSDPNATAKKAAPGAGAEGAAEGANGAAAAQGAPSELFASGTRSIERLIAKGDALLENQTWISDDRQGKPKLFQVKGKHVEYDTFTGEAKVIGDGSLLVYDTGERAKEAEAPPAQGAGEPVEPAGDPVAAMAGGKGISDFKWNESMDMKALGSQRFLVTMKDDVVVRHMGLRDNDTLTLTCRTLETTLLRPGFEPGVTGMAKPANATTGTLAKSADVDLGGPAELLRVKASGQVHVGTPDADIDCEIFDYDVPTQIAQMSARDGRLVTVLRRDSPVPVKAASVIWDRATGRMTIQSGSGAIGR